MEPGWAATACARKSAPMGQPRADRLVKIPGRFSTPAPPDAGDGWVRLPGRLPGASATAGGGDRLLDGVECGGRRRDGSCGVSAEAVRHRRVDRGDSQVCQDLTVVHGRGAAPQAWRLRAD